MSTPLRGEARKAYDKEKFQQCKLQRQQDPALDSAHKEKEAARLGAYRQRKKQEAMSASKTNSTGNGGRPPLASTPHQQQPQQEPQHMYWASQQRAQILVASPSQRSPAAQNFQQLGQHNYAAGIVASPSARSLASANQGGLTPFQQLQQPISAPNLPSIADEMAQMANAPSAFARCRNDLEMVLASQQMSENRRMNANAITQHQQNLLMHHQLQVMQGQNEMNTQESQHSANVHSALPQYAMFHPEGPPSNVAFRNDEPSMTAHQPKMKKEKKRTQELWRMLSTERIPKSDFTMPVAPVPIQIRQVRSNLVVRVNRKILGPVLSM